jgi:hypothetical protein
MCCYPLQFRFTSIPQRLLRVRTHETYDLLTRIVNFLKVCSS